MGMNHQPGFQPGTVSASISLDYAAQGKQSRFWKLAATSNLGSTAFWGASGKRDCFGGIIHAHIVSIVDEFSRCLVAPVDHNPVTVSPLSGCHHQGEPEL